jgi:hypothetical protein
MLVVSRVHGLRHLRQNADAVRDAIRFQVGDGDLDDLAAHLFIFLEHGFAGSNSLSIRVTEPGPVHADLQPFEIFIIPTFKGG